MCHLSGTKTRLSGISWVLLIPACLIKLKVLLYGWKHDWLCEICFQQLIALSLSLSWWDDFRCLGLYFSCLVLLSAFSYFLWAGNMSFVNMSNSWFVETWHNNSSFYLGIKLHRVDPILKQCEKKNHVACLALLLLRCLLIPSDITLTSTCVTSSAFWDEPARSSHGRLTSLNFAVSGLLLYRQVVSVSFTGLY